MVFPSLAEEEGNAVVGCSLSSARRCRASMRSIIRAVLCEEMQNEADQANACIFSLLLFESRVGIQRFAKKKTQ
jgi:hypothetical protein